MTQPTQPTITAQEIAEALGQHQPTPEQQAIIEAPLEPMLVVAGAGSGKTETMSARVVWLIANALVRPEQILGLTFTRKAAAELAHRIRQRLKDLARAGLPGFAELGLDLDLNRPHVVTYNSYAANLVREHGLRIGVEPDATLMTEATGWQLAANVAEQWQEDLRTQSALSTVTKAIITLSDTLSEHLVDLDEARQNMDLLEARFQALPVSSRTGQHTKDDATLIASVSARRDLLELVAAYRERKRSEDLVSFSDQIEYAARLAQQVPKVRRIERARFKVVLLDEYQDTSYGQVELLAGLFGQGHPVTAVGDPHQSIYGWRGASPSGLSHFPQRFPRPDAAPAPVRSLSTSWRNDSRILAAANLTAAPLRATSLINVTELQTRPNAGAGELVGEYHLTVADEAKGIANYLLPRHKNGKRCAVLCRNRDQFVELEAALRAVGLPVEVVGLGGLLSDPAVNDITSLLTVCHDLARGDGLMRLMTGPRFGIGPRDISALADLASQLDHAAQGASQDLNSDPNLTQVSVIEALEDLPRDADWTSRAGRSFSAAGLARLQDLAQIIDAVRSVLHQPLVEVVVAAERALGLDIELQSHPQSSHGRIRLDAFHDVAANFSATSTSPSLGGFLAWLDAARTQERGLDKPVNELDANAVQLITVHGAKGLEWDVVAVAGLQDGRFPNPPWNEGEPKDSGWLTGLGTLPWPLRGDAADLPELHLDQIQTNSETKAAVADFRFRCGLHAVAEERRLAYVAFTRAREALYLSGAWWRTTARTPHQPSPFYRELVDAGLLHEHNQVPAPDAAATNPALAEPQTGNWPASTEPRTVTQLAAVELLAQAAQQLTNPATPPQSLHTAQAQTWLHTAELLLAEQTRNRNIKRHPVMPAHLTASNLVRLSKDRAGFLEDLLRPVPQPPSRAARRGTAFHSWIEHHFGQAGSALFELEDLESFDDSLVELDDISTLREAFLSSQWADRQPFALEQQVDMVLGGVPLRMKIDAVFQDPDAGFTLVDWKSGRQPKSATEREHVSIQLALYRLAWARWQDVALELVRPFFFYAADGQTVAPQREWSEAELTELIPQLR